MTGRRGAREWARGAKCPGQHWDPGPRSSGCKWCSAPFPGIEGSPGHSRLLALKCKEDNFILDTVMLKAISCTGPAVPRAARARLKAGAGPVGQILPLFHDSTGHLVGLLLAGAAGQNLGCLPQCAPRRGPLPRWGGWGEGGALLYARCVPQGTCHCSVCYARAP